MTETEQARVERVEEDRQCVAAVLAGELAAYGRLYDRYARLVRAICFDTTLDLSQANDLCQETFLRAYRKLGELREPEKFARWLVGIARFVCREWVRSKARDRHQYIGLIIPPGDPMQPRHEPRHEPRDPSDSEELRRLQWALARLPEDERIAVHLFYLEEQSAEQARLILNLSRPGFYKLLERARQKLARLLTTPLQENKR
jgi:RNA polymerase sigma-70 factor (ECF subfamily)